MKLIKSYLKNANIKDRDINSDEVDAHINECIMEFNTILKFAKVTNWCTCIFYANLKSCYASQIIKYWILST